jgi:hypothetical protein
MSGVLAGRRRGTGRLLVGLSAVSLVAAGFAAVGTRGHSAQATVSPANAVHAFGGAPALIANVASAEPYAAIASTPAGGGYWVAAQDGGVFALGSAAFYGSAGGQHLNEPIVGLASTPSGRGYWLVAADGGVFAFGDAVFSGSEAPQHVNDATGIAAGSQGYWVVRRDGSVRGFGTGAIAAAASVANGPGAATVGIAARPTGGFWTVQAQQPDIVDHMNPFLVCTRSHESSHTPPAYDNGYQAVNPSGTYRGAYQFSRSTWNNTALRAGRLDLVGVDPAAASVPDQDLLALDLYHWSGAGPWMGRCGGL